MRISPSLFDAVHRRAEEIVAIVEKENGRHRLYPSATFFLGQIQEGRRNLPLENGLVILPSSSMVEAAYTLLLSDVRQGRAIEEPVIT